MTAAAGDWLFFDNCPDPLWIFDPESLRLLKANGAAVRAFGYEADELLAMTIADLRPPEQVPALLQAVAHLDDRFVEAGVWALRRKTGEPMDADIRWQPMLHEGRRAVLASIRDVSRLVALEREREMLLERERQSRRAAEASARHFQSLFEAAPGSFLVLSAADLEIVAVSDAYLAATMTRREEIKGRRLFDVFPDDPAEPGADGVRNLRASLERVRATGRADAMPVQRYPIPRRDGGPAFEERFWSAVNTPVRDADGGIACIIHRVEDITELVRVAEASGEGEAAVGRIDSRNRMLAQDILLRSLEVTRANDMLREQQANLRTAQRLLGLGLWSLDLKSGALSWSDDVYEIYGRAHEGVELDFAAYVAMVHPDDRQEMRDRYAAFEASGERTYHFAHRILRPDGRTIHIRGSGELTDGIEGTRLTGVVQEVTAQVEAEAQLARSAALLRMAGHAARLGGWRLDLEPMNLTWTPETAAILDEPEDVAVDLEQALGYYQPPHRERIQAVLQDCIREGRPFDEVLQVCTARGRRVWVRAIGEPERDGAGRVGAVQGAFQDITELVEIRMRSERLSHQLGEMLEHISDAFFTLDADWRFAFVNGQAERLLARSRQELQGKVVWEEFPDAVGSTFQEQYEHAMRSGQTVRFTELYPPLGAWFEVNAYPVPEGLAVYFRDVTEQKAAEEALRVSEERFRLVGRATNDAIWDWDLVSGTVWWNEGLKTLFGHDPASVEPGPESWTDRIHPEDRGRVTASIHAAIDASASNWNDEYRFLHADGRAVAVIDRGFIIRDGAGRAVRMLGSMIDVSERKEMEERLRQSQKLEAVGQLTGGVAHDFNNLLTVILGNAEMMLEQAGDRPALRQLAELTVSAAQRGAQLTSRLLAFARRQALEPRLVDINRLVGGLDTLLRRTLTENIDIEIVRAGGLWQVEVDPGQLESALLNLAINSRDAMPGGGCLTLETANARLDEDYARRHEDLRPGQYVMISVSDTGSGMGPETAARAFEPFFTTKEVGKGSGLGLSMVYGFVKQSGGHAKIYTEPGEGTTIRLYFPRARAGAEAGAELPAAVASSGGDEHVLVVEDDDMVRSHLIAQLRTLGYRVTGAANGAAALRILQAGPEVDLLFTDVVMPGGRNGRELADAARALHPGLPILFTSGYTENAIVHHGRLDPDVHLLQKPYRRDELAAKVRAVLDRP